MMTYSIKPTKKQRILELIQAFEDFEFCGPGDDPDDQSAMCNAYYNMVSHLRILVCPFLSKSLTDAIDGIDVEPEDITSVYKANAVIIDILGDIKEVIEGLEEDDFDSAKGDNPEISLRARDVRMHNASLLESCINDLINSSGIILVTANKYSGKTLSSSNISAIENDSQSSENRSSLQYSFVSEISDVLSEVYSKLSGPGASETAILTHPEFFGPTKSSESHLPVNPAEMYSLCQSSVDMMSKVTCFISPQLKDAIEALEKYENKIQKIQNPNLLHLLVKSQSCVKKIEKKVLNLEAIHQDISKDLKTRLTPEKTTEEDMKWVIGNCANAYSELMDEAEIKLLYDLSCDLSNYSYCEVSEPILKQKKVAKKSGKKSSKKRRNRMASSELSLRETEVYGKVHVQGKKPKEIAIELKCSVQNIYNHLKNAEKKMSAKKSRSVSIEKSQDLPHDKRGQEIIEDKR